MLALSMHRSTFTGLISRFKSTTAVLVLLAACSSAGVAGSSDEEQYYNLDIDGDDINDVVIGGCSPSLQPADPCSLLIKLSSGKEVEFTFNVTERYFLARYRSRIYVISTDTPLGDGERSRNVLRLDSNGITLVCSRLSER